MLSIGCQFIISGPTFLSVCLAILPGRDHSGGDHGYILYTLYMIHVVTKVGSARRVPANESDVGAERTGGSIPVEVGLGSRRPPTVTLWRSDKRWAWPWSAFAVTSK